MDNELSTDIFTESYNGISGLTQLPFSAITDKENMLEEASREVNREKNTPFFCSLCCDVIYCKIKGFLKFQWCSRSGSD